MAKKKTFEDSLAQLEDIVEALEDGDLPLETAIKSLKGFACPDSALTNWRKQKKVSLLLEDQTGALYEKPFFDGSAGDTSGSAE
ncbi:MAG: exodeoxyribonuclease VII small subunit [Desulfobacterales bacterium]